MNFSYTAKSEGGATVQGLLAAASQLQAQAKLREKGLFVVSLVVADGAKTRKRRGSLLPKRGGVSRKEILTLTTQISIMVRAGVDMATALKSAADHCTNLVLKKKLTQIHEDVLEGKPVSVALGSHEKLFGRTYIAGIAAAEKSGRLADVLDRLAHLLRSDLRMRSTISALLAYPIILTLISLLAVGALGMFVLPQFARVFEQLDVTLPAITRILIGISAEIRARFLLWAGIGAVAVFAVRTAVRHPTGRRMIDGWLLNWILVRDVTRALAIGRAFRLFGTMLESGVPLVEGLRLTRSSIKNSILRDFFSHLEDEVVNGRGLGASFSEATFVPSSAAQMLNTAEQTGTLASVTQLMGEYYEEEGETRLRELATILEPIIVVVMGGVIALVVMSVMLPVFDFATATKH